MLPSVVGKCVCVQVEVCAKFKRCPLESDMHATMQAIERHVTGLCIPGHTQSTVIVLWQGKAPCLKAMHMLLGLCSFACICVWTLEDQRTSNMQSYTFEASTSTQINKQKLHEQNTLCILSTRGIIGGVNLTSHILSISGHGQRRRVSTHCALKSSFILVRVVPHASFRGSVASPWINVKGTQIRNAVSIGKSPGHLRAHFLQRLRGAAQKLYIKPWNIHDVYRR